MDKLEYFSGIPEVGIVPRAPHAGPLLRHVYEQEHGRGGFAGKVSHTYHLYPPNNWLPEETRVLDGGAFAPEWDSPLRPLGGIHHALEVMAPAAPGDVYRGMARLVANATVAMNVTAPRAAMDHKNLDYLETIGYHVGEFFSRGGVFREGMVSVHPVGLPHGPHPPALRAFLDGRRPETFDEVGIMADFATPAQISELALGSSRTDYMESWAAYATDPRFRFSETRLHDVRRLADRLAGERDRLRPAPLDDEDGA